MKTVKMLSVVLVMMFFACSDASAAGDTAVENGAALFANPAFADGKKSCDACHPNGKGLEASGTKASYYIFGEFQNSLEEAVNVCLVQANHGKAIPVDSQEMKDVVSYIKSLGK